MAKQNLTVFQKLGKILGPDGIKTKDIQPQTQRYNIKKDVLLKTTDKAEYETAKLQAQQNQYLGKVWKKVEHGLFQQAINYETTRIGSYSDFEAMEFYPEIAATLDIMMEESTTLNSNGRMMNVYSESKRVKGILEDLFFNRLDIHTSLPMWIRNLCKYGDNFVYLNIDDRRGIVGGKQMPNYEMERREAGLFDTLVQQESEESGTDKVKFYWRGRDVEFNSWQMAHFRLLGDDRRLPYGTCLKGDTRITTEDSVVEIKDINIGEMVWSFDEKTQTKILSKVLDKINSGIKTCYKISTRHNYFDASEEHRIMVFDKLSTTGFSYKSVKNLELGDLLIIDKSVSTNKTISIDKSLPDENKNGWFNRCEELIPSTMTEELAQLFGFLIGDGWLHTHNPSLAIALGVDSTINDYYIKLLQKFSGNEGTIIDNKQFVIHSKLFKTILERLEFKGKFNEKRIPKWVFESDKEIQKAFIAGLFDADGWETEDKWTKAFHFELSNEQLVKDIKILLQRLGYKTGKIGKRNRKETSKGILGRTFKEINDSYYITFYDSYNRQVKIHDVLNRLDDNYIVEKIISKEEIGDFETYDIYVENDNHNFYANGIVVHNSVLEKARRIWKQLLLSEDAMLVYRVTRAPERRVYKIYVGNMDDKDVEPYVNAIANRFKRTPIVDPQTGQMDLRYNQLSNDQDYFIPVRSEDAPNPIDTLPGATNLDQIADIEYLQRKLFTALRVPKAFLGFEEPTGEGKNLALQDIRFSRTVNRIQQGALQELNKIAIIHLYLLGFDEDLDNFSLTLNNPSTQAEMLKIEHTQQKVTLFKDAVSDAGNGFGTMSMTRGHREIMGWSDDEIKQDLLEQRMEKAAAAELANSSAVIKHTGMFDIVDRIYGDMDLALKGGGAPAEGEEGGGAGGGGGLGGGFGGGGAADTDLDFGGEDGEGDEDGLGGETGGTDAGAGTEEAGTEETGEGNTGEEGAEAAPTEEPKTTAEGIKKTKSILTERDVKKVQNLLAEQKVKLSTRLNQRTEKYKNKFIDRLIDMSNNAEKGPEKVKIYDKNVRINESVNTMIGDIDKMLAE